MKDEFDDMYDDNSEGFDNETEAAESDTQETETDEATNPAEDTVLEEAAEEEQEVTVDVEQEEQPTVESETEEEQSLEDSETEEGQSSDDIEGEIEGGEVSDTGDVSDSDGEAPEQNQEEMEENLTENVIEEVAEKVKSTRQKPQPSKHNPVVEAQNATASDESGVITKNIDVVMHESMIPYSEFVIMDRALPRVEDGLKPVQRRIMFAMNDMGLHPDKPFRKSAGIVGECLGKYHPHGDTSVYDAMVRLAQPFNMNMPLVTGQGNFGSDDGDPPAAMRYTEAKLSPLAMELLRDINKETVPFSLTFDDRHTEPDILPGRYPNLLTNGATGIAVGLATNIPPHNLGELIDAHVAYIDNPKITLGQTMKIIKGPDFPTGAYVVCGPELVNAYKGGKGKVIMRGKVHIEIEGNDRRSIIITELPYQVNKVTLQKNIADQREQRKGLWSGISEIRDESDRRGTRIVIKIKKEYDAKEICELLFKYTNLQCNYNINMVAIAAGKPKLMGLMEMISYYVEYQREVIYKRSVFDLENAKERAHILEGLLIAIRNIDEVVRIIKTSKHTSEARDKLRQAFELSERQAQAILDLRLARLTSLEVYRLEQELAELKALIKKLSAIVASKKLQFDVVKQELLEIKKKFKIDRRSRIISDLSEAVITADDDEKPIEEVVVTLTAAATIKRMTSKHFSMSKTEFGPGLTLFDLNTVVIQTQTDKLLYVFTQFGNCYKIDVGDIPECKLRERGTKLKDIFDDSLEGERPIAVYALTGDVADKSLQDEIASKGELVWLSKLGMIKRSTWADGCGVQKSAFQCYKLREDRPDKVLRVDEFKPGNTLLLISSQGNILNAMTDDVPVQGRIASGVKGISMADTDVVACACVAKPRGFVVAVTSKGNVKRTEMKNIDKMVRYRKGLQFGSPLDKGESIVFGSWIKADEDLVVQTDQGKLYHIAVDQIPLSDRTGKWKAIKDIPKGSVIKKGYVHRRKKNN